MTGRRQTSAPGFDAQAFAERLAPAIAARAITTRALGGEIGLSPSTISRACRGWPDLSHAAFLKLSAWLGAEEGKKAGKAA